MRIITVWLEEPLFKALVFELSSWLYMQGTERFHLVLAWWSRFLVWFPQEKPVVWLPHVGNIFRTHCLLWWERRQLKGGVKSQWLLWRSGRVWRRMGAVPPPEGEMQHKSNLSLPTGNLYRGSVLQTVSVETHTCRYRCHQPYNAGM